MTEKEVNFKKKGDRSWDEVAFWCKRVGGGKVALTQVGIAKDGN